jgi:hypothetical protein
MCCPVCFPWCSLPLRTSTGDAMSVAQTMTLTLFGWWQDNRSCWVRTVTWMWWLLSGPVFYRAMLVKMVILIEEAWICDTKSSEEGPCKWRCGRWDTNEQVNVWGMACLKLRRQERRVHEARYEFGGRLGVPLRLSETCTVSGEDTLEATPVGWKVLTTPTKCTPFYTSSMTSHCWSNRLSRGGLRLREGRATLRCKAVMDREQNNIKTWTQLVDSCLYSRHSITHRDITQVILTRRRLEGDESRNQKRSPCFIEVSILNTWSGWLSHMLSHHQSPAQQSNTWMKCNYRVHEHRELGVTILPANTTPV